MFVGRESTTERIFFQTPCLINQPQMQASGAPATGCQYRIGEDWNPKAWGGAYSATPRGTVGTRPLCPELLTVAGGQAAP